MSKRQDVVTVTNDGRVKLPVSLAEQLDIIPGDILDVTLINGGIVFSTTKNKCRFCNTYTGILTTILDQQAVPICTKCAKVVHDAYKGAVKEYGK